jgi:hypothetical protein
MPRCGSEILQMIIMTIIWSENSGENIRAHCATRAFRSSTFDSTQNNANNSLYEQLEDIVDLAAKSLPERPDGIVAVAKFTSTNPECSSTEASYERLARDNPATIFLRCFKEMEFADNLLQRAQVEVFPTFDVFYKGNRVARVVGPRYSELETILSQYQLLNSDLDLFSESANDAMAAQSQPQPTPWGEQGSAKVDLSKTPRTTASFSMFETFSIICIPNRRHVYI